MPTKTVDDRGTAPLESETTSPRSSRPSPSDGRDGAERPSRINIVHAETPLFESNTGRISPVPPGGTPPRGSAALRDSSPGRASRPSGLPARSRAGRVLAVTVALLAALVIGVFLVSLFDHDPSRGTNVWKRFLEPMSWSAVVDYFFPPSH